MLGHDEQRNAFGAGKGFAVWARDFGQHQVDDVFCQFVVTGGDPHFVTAQSVSGTQWVVCMVGTVGRGAGGDIR